MPPHVPYLTTPHLTTTHSLPTSPPQTPEAKEAVSEWANKVIACHSGEAALGIANATTPGEGEEADATAGTTPAAGGEGEGDAVDAAAGGEAVQESEGESEASTPPPGFVQGDKIECRHGGGDDYFPGVIKKVRKDGTYDIDYEDGDKEKSVEVSLIKHAEGESEEEVEVEEEAPAKKGRTKASKADKENGAVNKAKGKAATAVKAKGATKAARGRAKA